MSDDPKRIDQLETLLFQAQTYMRTLEKTLQEFKGEKEKEGEDGEGKSVSEQQKRGRGRPKGSKNKPKQLAKGTIEIPKEPIKQMIKEATKVETKVETKEATKVETNVETVNASNEPKKRGRPPAQRVLPPSTRPWTLEENIEQALLDGALTLPELAVRVDQTPEALQPVLDELHKRGKVANLGPDNRRCWTWRLGDSGVPQDALNIIRSLIKLQYLGLQDLMHLTGITRQSRVSGCIVALKRSEPHMVEEPTAGHALLYFIDPPKARAANLEPRIVKKI